MLSRGYDQFLTCENGHGPEGSWSCRETTTSKVTCPLCHHTRSRSRPARRPRRRPPGRGRAGNRLPTPLGKRSRSTPPCSSPRGDRTSLFSPCGCPRSLSAPGPAQHPDTARLRLLSPGCGTLRSRPPTRSDRARPATGRSFTGPSAPPVSVRRDSCPWPRFGSSHPPPRWPRTLPGRSWRTGQPDSAPRRTPGRGSPP